MRSAARNVASGRPRDEVSAPRSLMPRLNWRRGLEQSEPLKGQLWTRSEQSLREPDVHWAWRGLAVAAVVAESAVLAWLWFGPALAVQTVDVQGAQH